MMSAFLVENKTIDKILHELQSEIRRSEHWFKKEVQPNLPINFHDENWQTELGQWMLDLNQLSLKYRYGDEKKELTYTFHEVRCSKVEAFKALRCWLYQCAEGNIPEDSSLYRFFDTVVIPRW